MMRVCFESILGCGSSIRHRFNATESIVQRESIDLKWVRVWKQGSLAGALGW